VSSQLSAEYETKPPAEYKPSAAPKKIAPLAPSTPDMLAAKDSSSYAVKPAMLNFADSLGSNSRMSLRTVDSKRLTEIHPERYQSAGVPPRTTTAAISPKPLKLKNEVSSPAMKNFKDMLGPNSKMSLSTVDSTKLTAIHPERTESTRMVASPTASVSPKASQPKKSPVNNTAATKNFKDMLGPNSTRSLSTVDSKELTAIHPTKVERPSWVDTQPKEANDPQLPSQRYFNRLQKATSKSEESTLA